MWITVSGTNFVFSFSFLWTWSIKPCSANRACSRKLFCIKISIHGFENLVPFFSKSTFYWLLQFFLAVAISLRWYLHFKHLSRGFNIYHLPFGDKKHRSIRSSYLELVTLNPESQIVFQNIEKVAKWYAWALMQS